MTIPTQLLKIQGCESINKTGPQVPPQDVALTWRRHVKTISRYIMSTFKCSKLHTSGMDGEKVWA